MFINIDTTNSYLIQPYFHRAFFIRYIVESLKNTHLIISESYSLSNIFRSKSLYNFNLIFYFSILKFPEEYCQYKIIDIHLNELLLIKISKMII